jgi:hypothetical protein
MMPNAQVQLRAMCQWGASNAVQGKRVEERSTLIPRSEGSSAATTLDSRASRHDFNLNEGDVPTSAVTFNDNITQLAAKSAAASVDR